MFNNIDWMKKRWLPLAAATGFLVLILLAVVRPSPEMNLDVSIAPLVETIKVGKQALNPVIQGYGRAQPRESWAAISEVNGRVIFRHPDLEKGRILPFGTVVIKIDPVDYELALAQSRSSLKSSELELERVKLNERAYNQSKQIEQSRLEIAKKELKRKEDLKKKGLISSSELEAQRNAVLAQEQSVWDLDSKLALIPTDKDVAQANLKVALAKLQEAERSLSRTEVKLPFDARIGQVNVELDQVVNLQQTMLEVHDTSMMEITANMSLSDMRRLIGTTTGDLLEPSQTAPDIRNLNLKSTVSLAIGDHQFEWQGKVDRIDDSIDINANTIGLTVQVNTSLQQSDLRKSPPLIKDMYVQVSVIGSGREMLVVPSRAIHGSTLYVIDTENRLSMRQVEIAFEQSGQTAIEKGLAVGETIVLTDLLAPTEGMKVRVVDDKSDEGATL